MTTSRQTRTKFTGLLAAAAIAAACITPQFAAPRGSLPLSDSVNAAVTIKTQQAADSIQGGIRGIDVSKYQGNISWDQVASDNVNFAMIRASYGTKDDPYFVTNARQAHANGLKVGAYHYATFVSSATVREQADHFLGQLRQVDITYPVVLDFEDSRYTKADRQVVTKLARQFMDIISAEGYTVMLYSYSNFIRDHLDVSMLSGYDFWVANYLEQPTTVDHKMWQHTSYGTVSGISGRVDINIAYQDLSIGGIRASATTPTVRKVQVDKTVSESIKRTLNDRYGLGLPMQGVDMAQMNRAIIYGLQSEVNTQWGVNYNVNGDLSNEQLGHLQSLTFTSSTSGNITYLFQVKLFYKGYYSGSLTSSFDDNTVRAVLAYQQDAGLSATGTLDAATIQSLLR